MDGGCHTYKNRRIDSNQSAHGMRQISRHEEGKELEMSRLERGIQDGSHRFPQLPEGPSCEGALFDLTQLSPKMEFELGGSSRDNCNGNVP